MLRHTLNRILLGPQWTCIFVRISISCLLFAMAMEAQIHKGQYYY